LNNKLKSSTKKTNAIFLAVVLIAGTITALSSFTSSFMIVAQAQPYYYDGGTDTRYNIYEPKPEYQPQYAEKEYNIYKPEYGMDDYERKSYENNSVAK
jgi:hypothetical protein